MGGVKHIVILIDGAADDPLEALGGKTPLEAARKPEIDALAAGAEMGLVRTIPDGLPAGSDTANLSIFGYDPRTDYTGRSSLEAVSMGVELADDDVTFRCNLVTLSEAAEFADRTMIDYSAGEIPSDQSRRLIADLAASLESGAIAFHAGISYRHLIIWKRGPGNPRLIPPHDISGRTIGPHLPQGGGRDVLLDLMVRSVGILKDHPVNKAREAAGERPANAIWIWGEGRKPRLVPFAAKYGVEGSVISAVDLVRGIGLCAGLKPIAVPGATGNIHTNFAGKAAAALDELRDGRDFVYLHVEAPDECGHQGDIAGKVRSIEMIDEKIVGPVRRGLQALGTAFRIMVLPDHPTPIAKRTHTSEPVPFLIFDSRGPLSARGTGFDEARAAATGLRIEEGFRLMGRFLGCRD
jgi:2,3-bisphosphoglycerate-independent phosphoglycerate mutase